MADPNLTESAWQRAKEDAAGVYRTTTFQLGGALVTTIFSALALFAQEGQPGATTQVAVTILAAAVAMLLSVVVVLVCQLAAAPVRQRNELRQNWNRPDPNPIQPVNVGLSLRDFRRQGDDLLKSLRGGYITEDEETAERWTRETIQFLSQHCDPALAQTFIDASRGETNFLPSLQARISALDGIIDNVG
jgi:hypothetical protein